MLLRLVAVLFPAAASGSDWLAYDVIPVHTNFGGKAVFNFLARVYGRRRCKSGAAAHHSEQSFGKQQDDEHEDRASHPSLRRTRTCER